MAKSGIVLTGSIVMALGQVGLGSTGEEGFPDMVSLFERAKALLLSASSSPSEPTHLLSIAPDHVDDVEGIGRQLTANEQYFEVRLNELFLTTKRQWFSTYDPMAVAVVEYQYGGRPTAVPFVVGPAMIESTGSKLPLGMVFAGTRIAGPQPYRGDGLGVTVILYRLQRDDMLRKMLRIIEKTSKAIDFTGATGAYTKIAEAVLDGIDEVKGANNGALPVLGRRQEYLPVPCGYYALIDGAVPAPSEDRLWVRKKQLMIGNDMAGAQPFRSGDYVLYSISSVPREDVSGLTFYPTYLQVMEEAQRARQKEIWESAKVKMSTLYSLLHASPDLTRGHAEDLTQKWTTEMVTLKNRAVGLSKLGAGEGADTAEDARQRARALDILKL